MITKFCNTTVGCTGDAVCSRKDLEAKNIIVDES